uniref:Endonuclease n=1 Tax=Solanum tuberosum TaxID=4113 RepID=M1BK37_SOLTU
MTGCPHNFWYVGSQGTKCVLVSPIPVTKFKTLSLRSRPGVLGKLSFPSLELGLNYSVPLSRHVCFGI